jgi:hypothetical protein
MRVKFFVPPVLRRPLRKSHDAILCAVREGDMGKAERLFLAAPATYQAATLLLAFFSAERWLKTTQ